MGAVHDEGRGAMDAGYAAERTRKAHLAYRLRVRAAVVADLVRRHLGTPPGPKVLDLGCAEGRTLLEIRERLGTGEYVGIECSADLLGCAPPLPDDVRLVEGDAAALPAGVGEGRFDVVTALALLEHLADPAAALLQARRALRPGGVVVATSPVPTWDRIAGRLGLLADEHHVGALDEPAFRRAAAAAGLEAVAYGRFMWAPVGFLPYLGIRVDARLSAAVDRAVDGLPLLGALFVNQWFVARRGDS